MNLIGQPAAKSFAYLLGVYLGDGHVSSASGNYAQSTIDQDFADAVVRAFADLGAKTSVRYVEVPKKGHNCSPHWSIYCGARAICERFVNETDRKQKIPAWLHEEPIEVQKQFVIGLMDSEGFVARNHANDKGRQLQTGRSYYMGYKSCDVWVSDLIKIMERVGLRVGKVSQEKPRKPGYKTPSRFAIKMQSWVDAGLRFNIARKQDRIDTWAAALPYTERSYHPRGGPARFCDIADCGRPHRSKGLCELHYRRQAKAKLREHTPDSGIPANDVLQTSVKTEELDRNDLAAA